MSPRFSIRLLATQPDDRLIALAREGHERAFEALVRRYRRALVRYCQSMRLSDARAEDVVQQALMKAWLALGAGAEVREPRAWLYRIVHNTAVNAIRAAREVPTEPAGVLRERAAIGESELERKLDVRDALGHVAALPQMQRDAVLMTAVDGQSHDEVAVALGVSQGAVRGLLYRARTTLRGATAALTPTPLLEWAARGAGSAAPGAERIAELAGGAGAAGIAGVLVKGAAVAVSVGALATGVVVKLHNVSGDRARAHGGTTRTLAAGPATSAAASIGSTAPSQAASASGAPAHGPSTAGRRAGRQRGRSRKVASGGAPLTGGRRLLADARPGALAPVRSGPSSRTPTAAPHTKAGAARAKRANGTVPRATRPKRRRAQARKHRVSPRTAARVTKPASSASRPPRSPPAPANRAPVRQAPAKAKNERRAARRGLTTRTTTAKNPRRPKPPARARANTPATDGVALAGALLQQALEQREVAQQVFGP